MKRWQAKRIWMPETVCATNSFLYARKEFETAAVGSARVFIECVSAYQLYINGRRVGRGAVGGDSAYRYYSEYDVTHLLRPGKNVVAVLCYNDRGGACEITCSSGSLLLQLEIGNDSPQIVASDQIWKVFPGVEWETCSACVSSAGGFQEIYDSRRKPVGWNVVGFDDSDWYAASIVEDPDGHCAELAPRQIPHLREQEVFASDVLDCGVVERSEHSAADIATRMYGEQIRSDVAAVKYPRGILRPGGDSALVPCGADAFIVLDFGREVVGYPIVRIRDGGPAVIDLGCSEALDENGRVHTVRQGMLQADRLITLGGRQEWQTFGRRAFRYLQLTFRDLAAPLSLESVSVSAVGYPTSQVSDFECSDPVLNDIWRVGIYTLGLTMQDRYEASPLSGLGSHPVDFRVQALANYHCFFDTQLARKTLAEYTRNQEENGFLSALRSSSAGSSPAENHLVWVIALHDYYLYTGDTALVERLFPNLKLLMEGWVRAQEVAHRPLLSDATSADAPGGESALNTFYYRALRDASKLAAAAGCHDEARDWHSRAERVSAAFNQHFWSEEEGCCARLSPENLHADILAVLFGIADASRAESIERHIDSHAGSLRSCGPRFGFYVLQMMAARGLDTEALNLLRAIWGGMLRRGAATWWETFDPEWADGQLCPGSLCHGGSVGPTCYLSAEVLGVKPSIPDSDVVVIQPRPGDLHWARGRVATRASLVEVEWQRLPECFRMDVNAPSGFVAAIPVRGFRDPVIEEIDLSPETPERRARKTYGWGNVVWQNGEQRDPYLDWLSGQEADPPEHYQARRRLAAESDYVWVRESPVTHVRYEVHESGAV